MFQKFSRIALAGVLLPAFLFLSNGPDAQAQSNHRCANYPTNYVTDGRATVAGEGGLCAIGGGEPVERSSGNTIRCATGNKPTRPTGLTATAFHDSSESGIRLAWNAPGSATEADRNVWAYEIYRRNEVTETKMTLYHVLKRRLNTRVGTLPAGENWRVFPDSCFGPTATNPGIGANNPNGTCDTVPLGSDYRKRTPGLTYARYSHLNGPGCTRGTTGAVFVNQMLSWGSGNTTFVDPFVTPGQSYAYRVVAQTIHSELDTTNLHDHPGRNYAGKRRSDWSVAASATLTARAPGAPTGVGGTLDSSGFIKVSWTAPTATTTTSGPQGYQLRRSSDSGSTWTELPTLRGLSRALCNYGGTTVSCASATGTLPTSHIDKSASVTANTAYIYQVRAKRFHCINHGQIGNGCTDSEWTGSWSTSTASVTTGGTLTRDSALKPDKVIVDDSGNRPQPIPVPAQELPAGSATISADKTQLNLQEVVTLSAATANAPDGIAPKYHWQYHGNGRWLDLYAGQTWAPSFTYLEIKPQIMVFRVRVAYGTEYVADSAPVAVTWGNPDATVTIDGDTVTFNSPATGLPTISGTARVGETLTASTSGIADPDGLAGATFAYQWISSRDGTDTDIAGATASTYTLAAADAGAAIKVRVGFNDDNGNAATLTSAATAAVAAADGEAPPSVGKSVQRDTQQTAATTAAPGRVPGLRASLTSSGHVSLTWTAPGVEDDGSNAPAIYRIVRRAAGGAFGLLTSVPGVSTTHTDSTVAAGTSYVYRVQGVNGAGSGQLSPPAAIGAPHPLTAAFHGLPNGHNGKNLFTFEVRFSEDVSGLTAGPVKRALTVANGRIVDVTRAVSGKNRRWTVKVRPSSFDDIAIALAATADCSATGAICDSNGRKLTDAVSATVSGPVAVSVADARANEGPDAAVAFTVTLSRAAADTVTVDYATRDGTATAGADYTFTRGTLTFAVGETEKTVSVPLLDDAHDEGEETFTLKLTGAAGAVIADGEATGTIVNSDPLQQVWLARFGRTVAIQTVEALE
ncbi:MAG: hypothetical protein OXH87_11335, partial [Rhodospirillaceae bacterium]|nr:hypothetical protein [Rhodospirillaceae bacterium]